MFEAECPKCNISSEVINGRCKNCNYDIFEFMKDNGLVDGNRLITDKVFVCPNCGTIDAGGSSIRLKCYECDSVYKATDINRNKYWEDISQAALNGKMDDFNKELIEKTVGDTINWDLFNKRDEKWQKRLQEDNEQDRKKQAEEQARQDAINHPRCPKCGSTAIQMVPRKFSLLTGFATNKIDRVCVNCKHKW